MHWIALRPTPDAPPACVVPNVSGVPSELAPPQAPTLADALAAWAWHALQFTPLVAQVDGVLVLEVSSSERLFGGRHQLLQQLFKSNTDHTASAHMTARAMADSIRRNRSAK